MAGGFESPLTDSEVGTDTNTDKDLVDFLKKGLTFSGIIRSFRHELNR